MYGKPLKTMLDAIEEEYQFLFALTGLIDDCDGKTEIIKQTVLRRRSRLTKQASAIRNPKESKSEDGSTGSHCVGIPTKPE